ncbi:hypothetical protein FZI85_27740 [Mycobacterium sp. CBMA293]|uniref:Uncharacterized protein n=2 Tax=Mycolicibacterium sp. CBMA 213 TaxID=1968788 RepID=A0A1S6GKU0_9MYCO|nr:MULTISPECIES: hypothetical protein [unclassified Mycolicibacterium]AQS22487.1 hypothetical protein pCBMA213_2_00123 [Mycolicibacterium sp. CBMA 213]MUL48387.1 hypothetical protein [Mycolicibacterium sp. CBMA 360]MUL62399.1 hypothetical protein [Mycolicibacterium sp. CBMA 335]MUM04536.1 hypothetical protein [Mycolicibacterium sp. CBMA 213]MUM14799.1 hypothetical protein [Mycolicibacterium sp. CBMA 293]
MPHNRLATLANLRTEIVSGSCNPSPGLIELAGRLTVDPQYKSLLHKIAENRPKAAALLWIRISDHLSGAQRLEALALAAEFAFQGGSPRATAQLIVRAAATSEREHLEFPPLLDILKLDHTVRDHLPAAA